MRGYWLPPGYEKLAAFDGFFLKSDAVFISDNPTRDWDTFVHILTGEFTSAFPEFEKVNRWEEIAGEPSRYILLSNGTVKLIVDDTDGYIAVYLIVAPQSEKAKPAPDIRPLISVLQNILCKYYPKSIYKRISYRELKKIEGMKI